MLALKNRMRSYHKCWLKSLLSLYLFYLFFTLMMPLYLCSSLTITSLQSVPLSFPIPFFQHAEKQLCVSNNGKLVADNLARHLSMKSLTVFLAFSLPNFSSQALKGATVYRQPANLAKVVSLTLVNSSFNLTQW